MPVRYGRKITTKTSGIPIVTLQIQFFHVDFPFTTGHFGYSHCRHGRDPELQFKETLLKLRFSPLKELERWELLGSEFWM